MAIKRVKNNNDDYYKQKEIEREYKSDVDKMLRYERESAFLQGLESAKYQQMLNDIKQPPLQQQSLFPGSDGGRGIYGRHDHNLPDVLLDRTGINSIQTLAAMTNSDLLTLQKPLLTFMYAYYGIIQETIDRPIDDAFKHGIQLKIQSSPLDEVVFDTDDFMSYLEDMHVIRIVKDAMRYARLYGGAAIIITTNDTLPSEPLDVRTFKQDTKIKLYPIDRWELSWYGDVNFEYKPKKYDSRYIQVDSIYDPEYYIFRHNVVHRSRVLRILPKRPPSMLLELLQGWGLSEIEKSKKSLNAYFKACETSYSLMDESKVDVYKIDSLADSNLSWSGRESIKSRMKLQHQTKNVLTAIVLDKEDDYEQKHISFTGIAEMLQQYRINVSADSGIPVQKQWGLESMPFTSGEVSLDDYYNLVISNIRPKATEMLKKIITLYMIKYIGVPLKFKIEYYPLKSQTAMEEETIKQSKQNRFISAYANNAITYEQFIGLMNEAGLNKG